MIPSTSAAIAKPLVPDGGIGGKGAGGCHAAGVGVPEDEGTGGPGGWSGSVTRGC
ncbi:hypothetical protein [Marmoricola sp. RAF53]|uniref:hypothetical protein n=1 Tax=Marmoricola sp. RAF53 TaxID=3233059 RepID=UPI003F97F503